MNDLPGEPPCPCCEPCGCCAGEGNYEVLTFSVTVVGGGPFARPEDPPADEPVIVER